MNSSDSYGQLTLVVLDVFCIVVSHYHYLYDNEYVDDTRDDINRKQCNHDKNERVLHVGLFKASKTFIQ